MAETPAENKITWPEGGAWIALAALGDLAQAGIDLVMLGFGWTVNWTITLTFLFFLSLRLGLKGEFTLRRGLSMLGIFGGEIVPWVGDLPLLTGITIKVMYDIIKGGSALGKILPKVPLPTPLPKIK